MDGNVNISFGSRFGHKKPGAHVVSLIGRGKAKV
jgi:hypothetical protein